MEIGMMWLDDSKQRSMEEKVARAAAYYQEKYGRNPELCFVSVDEVDEEGKVIENIEVRPLRTILRNHFWLGMKPGKSTNLAQ